MKGKSGILISRFIVLASIIFSLGTAPVFAGPSQQGEPVNPPETAGFVPVSSEPVLPEDNSMLPAAPTVNPPTMDRR